MRQDSFNDIQDERNAKTAWRPRAHPDQYSGNTGGVKVNDNREVLLRALQTVVRNTDSPSNVHYEGSRDEAHLQQKMQERSYPNYSHKEPTLSPSRSLNFKDGAPVSKFNNTSKSPTKRATNKQYPTNQPRGDMSSSFYDTANKHNDRLAQSSINDPRSTTYKTPYVRDQLYSKVQNNYRKSETNKSHEALKRKTVANNSRTQKSPNKLHSKSVQKQYSMPESIHGDYTRKTSNYQQQYSRASEPSYYRHTQVSQMHSRASYPSMLAQHSLKYGRSPEKKNVSANRTSLKSASKRYDY